MSFDKKSKSDFIAGEGGGTRREGRGRIIEFF